VQLVYEANHSLLLVPRSRMSSSCTTSCLKCTRRALPYFYLHFSHCPVLLKCSVSETGSVPTFIHGEANMKGL
jgi:hypothetical protein